MKTYTFAIGSSDDFEGVEDLMDYVEANHDKGFQNYSIFEFDCPADCSQELVTMIGRGYAFSEDWTMDDSYSFLIEGSMQDTEVTETFDLNLVQCSEI